MLNFLAVWLPPAPASAVTAIRAGAAEGSARPLVCSSRGTTSGLRGGAVVVVGGCRQGGDPRCGWARRASRRGPRTRCGAVGVAGHLRRMDRSSAQDGVAERRGGLGEDHVEVEHVGVEADEAVEVDREHGNVDDTGECGHVLASFWAADRRRVLEERFGPGGEMVADRPVRLVVARRCRPGERATLLGS